MPPTPLHLVRAITFTPAIAGADLALPDGPVVSIALTLPPRRAPACCCGTLADTCQLCSSAVRPGWAGPTWPWPWARSSSTTTTEPPRSQSKLGRPWSQGGRDAYAARAGVISSFSTPASPTCLKHLPGRGFGSSRPSSRWSPKDGR